MSKRLLLSIVALSALAPSATEANLRCVQYRGAICTAYSTQTILVEVTFFNQNCPGGDGCSVDNIFAQTSDSIAFCTNPSDPSGPPIKTVCTENVIFSGPGNPCEVNPASCSGQGQPCPDGQADCCVGLHCVDNGAPDHTKTCMARGARATETCT